MLHRCWGEFWRLDLCSQTVLSSATVHSFEIHPQTFAGLSESTAGLSGVNLVNLGLSNRSEDLQLHCFRDEAGLTSAVDFPHPEHVQRKTITAKVISGDSYVSEKRIDHVDFLKIDVEGMEGQGAARI
jgi:FkbM family methyltransferase